MILVASEPATCTTHIDFPMALARDYVQAGRAIMDPAAEQIADMCIKPLGPGPFVVSRSVSFGLFLSCALSLVLFSIASSH